MFRNYLYLKAACLFLALSPQFAYSKEAAKPAKVANNTPSPDMSVLQQLSKGFSQVAKQATPAVVFIRCEVSSPDQDEMQGPYGYGSPYDPFGDDFLNRFFGGPSRSPGGRAMPQISQGSGFFISSDGYIATNNHVVKGADKITIVFDDNKELDATLIGTDPQTDLAVLKVEGKDFPYLNFANSDNIEVGEWAIAIGSPF